MKKLVVGAILALAIFFSGFYLGQFLVHRHDSQITLSVAADTSKVNPPTIAELLKLVNQERAKHGVAPLKEDPRLDASAQMKANDEVAYNYFGHISPANSPYAGKHGYEFINYTGIKCTSDSENLSRVNVSDITSELHIKGWINSPAHHAAMIDPSYTLTGFGINGNEAVEHFCQQ